MATRYVVASGGVTSGNATSVGTAWTLTYALSPGGGGNALAAGDTLVICQGDYPLTFAQRLFVNCATGTSSASIRIVGGDAAGNIYTNGSTVSIYATGSAASWGTGTDSAVVVVDTVGANGTTSEQYFIWENLTFDAQSVAYNAWSNGGATNRIQTNAYHQFINCRFTGSKHNSLSCYGYSTGTTEAQYAIRLFGCRVYNNGAVSNGNGVVSRSTSPCSFLLVNCECYGNKQGGFKSTASTLGNGLVNSAFYGQTATGSNGFGANLGSVPGTLVSGCTFYGNGGDGLIVTGGPGVLVCGNIFAGNTGVGINDVGYDGTKPCSSYEYNLYWNNAAGNFLDAAAASVTPPGSGNVLADPILINASTSSPNFALRPGSPALGTSGFALNCVPAGYVANIGAGGNPASGAALRFRSRV